MTLAEYIQPVVDKRLPAAAQMGHPDDPDEALAAREIGAIQASALRKTSPYCTIARSCSLSVERLICTDKSESDP